ncbi:hypothetical protein VMCG_09638 [Cytospora schulzeri]|uniref:Uncharacterized protein n=1 Tax=Cytospora schulzeri TaxID=448051 RepID=A0A423VEA0_9PEZI|nr:hypothetical protein VMCG_09638 [Valsa malicola]
MPRYSGWGGGWPFMYMHQPGGWGEQTWGMGFGNRNNRFNNNNNSNNLFPQYGDLNSHNSHNNPNTLNIDNLSGLFARLILQNHLTRLADIGCHGGALYGCSLPSTSTSQSPSSSSSSPQHSNNNPHSHHNHHNCNDNNINFNNRCQICVHTCPNATQPYMGTNNVFVIPAAHVQQQQQQHQQQPQVPGLTGVNLNNINMFLNSLGLALSGASNISGCGGGGMNNIPAGFSLLPVFGPGPGPRTCGGSGGAQANPNNGGFSCAACCNNHIRM